MYKYKEQNALFGGSFMNKVNKHRRKNEKNLFKKGKHFSAFKISI